MLSIVNETVLFSNTFTTTINVLVTDANGENTTTSLTIPSVSISFIDPGVNVSVSTGTVNIYGAYTTILPTKWTYLDVNSNMISSLVPPSVGQYSKIVQVDSPPMLTQNCIYTIDGEQFTHTVTLGSYTQIANKLKELLAGAL